MTRELEGMKGKKTVRGVAEDWYCREGRQGREAMGGEGTRGWSRRDIILSEGWRRRDRCLPDRSECGNGELRVVRVAT